MDFEQGKEIWIKLSKRSRMKLGFIIGMTDEYILVAIQANRKMLKKNIFITHTILQIMKEEFNSESKNRVYMEYINNGK